jgi:integrase
MRKNNFNPLWRRSVDGDRKRKLAGVFTGTDLEGLVFHELRHTAAALAIAHGAHHMTIKERLGHSSITVTLDRTGICSRPRTATLPRPWTPRCARS